MEKETLKKPIEWEKHHRFMPKDGMCGSTTIWMILDACGIKKSINEIAKYVHKWWWGTPPQLFVAYLSKFFSVVNYKNGATISDIAVHLKMGHIVVVNFWDKVNDEGDGHYTIVSEYKDGTLFMVDSSKEHDAQWGIKGKEFRKIWYDTLTVDDRLYHEGFMIWIDPKSKRI
jgi:hypothetical protein